MSLWSAEQREWLQALGHELLELAPGRSAGAADAPVLARETVAEMAPVTRAPAAAPAASANDDALLRALLRAARRVAVADLAAVLAVPAGLPRDPAAKRALWPRLRALRKAAPRS